VLWSSSAGKGLATGRSLAQDAPPTVYKQDAEIRTTAEPGPQYHVIQMKEQGVKIM